MVSVLERDKMEIDPVVWAGLLGEMLKFVLIIVFIIYFLSDRLSGIRNWHLPFFDGVARES